MARPEPAPARLVPNELGGLAPAGPGHEDCLVLTGARSPCYEISPRRHLLDGSAR